MTGQLLAVLLAISGHVAATESAAPDAPGVHPPSGRGRLRTVGLYVWKDSPDQHAFWKACGIDTLQFCDTHWSLRADVLGPYYAALAADVDRARRSGFRVNVLLFSNIAQWEGPSEREPTGTGLLFDPRDPAALEKRLTAIARAVRTLRHAHGFTLLAGDPGGAVGAPFGPVPAAEWVRMAKRVRDVVRREAPRAQFNVNPWAIAYWQRPDLGCGGHEWWSQEAELTRAVLADPELVGSGTGVEIPPHHYYRPLALRCFEQAGIAPERRPTAEDVRALRARRVPRIWAWPYFLLDEADDGDVGPDGRAAGIQIEARYIHRLVAQMRAIGMDGIIGNWSYAGHLAKALNTYAFGRFCRDERATPVQIIDEYARCVADEATWSALAQVLRYLEGESNWQRKLPPGERLPALPCDLATSEQALATLGSVRPRPVPLFALPEPPSAYLRRIEQRLRARTAPREAR